MGKKSRSYNTKNRRTHYLHSFKNLHIIVKHFLQYIIILLALCFWLTPKAQNNLTLSQIQLNESIVPDPETDSIISIYRTHIDSIFSEQLVECTEPLVWGKPDSSLGRTISDIFFAEATLFCEKNNMPKPDLALINLGGLRKDIGAGMITLLDVTELLPFENTLVFMQISGKELINTLMHAARRNGEPISNASITFANDTLTSVTIAGQPLDINHLYTLATIDYVAQGGDKFSMLKEIPYEQSQTTIRQLVIDHMRRLRSQGKKLTVPTNVRITIEK